MRPAAVIAVLLLLGGCAEKNACDRLDRRMAAYEQCAATPACRLTYQDVYWYRRHVSRWKDWKCEGRP